MKLINTHFQKNFNNFDHNCKKVKAEQRKENINSLFAEKFKEM